MDSFDFAGDLAAPLRRGTRFISTGSVGFGVNAVALLMLSRILGPLPAQALAYAIAMVVTFALNRYWTFRAHAAPWAGQGVRYALVTIAGAVAINGAYAAAVVAGAPPLLALAAGAVGWAVLSYVLLVRWVFRCLPVTSTD